MNSAPRLLKRPIRFQIQFRRFSIPGIPIRILIQLRRLARTLLAPYMATRSALLRARRKDCFAFMTSPANTLSDWLLDEILSARARGHTQRCGGVTCKTQVRRVRLSAILAGLNLGLNFRDLALGVRGVLIGILFAGWWVAGTFLAAWVLAIDADFVGAEGCFAAVTGAAHSHADRLGNSGELQVGG